MAEHDNSKIQFGNLTNIIKNLSYVVDMIDFLCNIPLGISISRDREKSGPIRLSLDHVSGAFTLLLIGLVISTMVFILEFVWFQFKKCKKHSHRSITV